MEWADFFEIYGKTKINIEDFDIKTTLTIEELYKHFENRFMSTHHVTSEELLYSADIVESD